MGFRFLWACGGAGEGRGAWSGLPGADAVQAAALLTCGGPVEALAARVEAVGDGAALLDGFVVVVLERGPYVGDLQAQAADAREHPAVRHGRSTATGGVVAGGLEVGELAAQQLGLGLGVVDDVGAADELDGRVVAGGDAVRRRGAGLGAPGARDEGVVAEDGEDDVRIVLDRLPGRVGPGEVDQEVVAVAVAGEVGGDGDGRLAGRAVDAQQAEVVALGDPRPATRPGPGRRPRAG